MVNFLSSLKKFDAHIKTKDSVNQKTLLGAILTLISAFLVLILIITEINYYHQINVESLMLTDSQAIHEPTLVQFDIDFDYLECSKISFTQDITRGTLHTNRPDFFEKKDTNQGCIIHATIATDKIGGNFKIEYDKKENQDPASFFMGMHNMNNNKMIDNNNKKTEEVQKEGQSVINLTHRINYLYFHATDATSGSLPPSVVSDNNDNNNNLSNKKQDFPPGAGIHQYVINVVHSQYIYLNKTIINKNAYSVTERHVDADQKEYLQSVGGGGGLMSYGQDFTGVIFTYDFTPVVLVQQEVRESIFEFLASLCGIVGGFIVVLGLIERLLQSSAKAIMGKKD